MDIDSLWFQKNRHFVNSDTSVLFLVIFVSETESEYCYTVIILNIGTDRSEQTVQTLIRLLSLIRVFSVCYSVCIF